MLSVFLWFLLKARLISSLFPLHSSLSYLTTDNKMSFFPYPSYCMNYALFTYVWYFKPLFPKRFSLYYMRLLSMITTYYYLPALNSLLFQALSYCYNNLNFLSMNECLFFWYNDGGMLFWLSILSIDFHLSFTGGYSLLFYSFFSISYFLVIIVLKYATWKTMALWQFI